jgi:hypothetical protein
VAVFVRLCISVTLVVGLQADFIVIMRTANADTGRWSYRLRVVLPTCVSNFRHSFAINAHPDLTRCCATTTDDHWNIYSHIRV